ncbi:MAG: NUDIX hydrolase [Pseudomonadota bacterium]
MTANETMWVGKYLSIRRQGRWEYAERTRGLGAAVIMATTDADELVLIEEYRVPLGRACLSFPAGLVGDEGAGDNGVGDNGEAEDPAASARRELEEETGFRAARMEPVGAFASSPGLTSETFTLFRATGLTRVGEGGGVDGEEIVVRLVPKTEVAAAIADARARGLAIDVKLLALMRLL